MDWINMIQKGAAAIEAETTSQNQLSAYAWQFSGQINTRFPNMAPYITGISINAISSTINFMTVDRRHLETGIKRFSPSSFFFAPNNATLYNISASLSGNPLSIGRGNISQVITETEITERPDPLEGIGVPRSPFPAKEEEEPRHRNPSEELVPPPLIARFDMPRTTGNTGFSIDYRLSASSSSNLKFDTGKWSEYGDINWGDVSSIITNFAGNAETIMNFNHSLGIFSSAFTFSGNGTWGQYSFLNEDATEFLTSPGSGETDPQKVANARAQEYNNSNFSTSYGFTSSFKPLFFSTMFGNSNFSYNLRGLAVKSNFIGTGDDPDWELIFGEWDKEKIDAHNLSATLSALIMDKTQSLAVTANLPPLDESYSFNSRLLIWISDTNASWGFRRNLTDDDWIMGIFTANSTFNFLPVGNFRQTFNMDTEKKEVTTLSSTLSFPNWWNIQASYTASRLHGFNYIEGTGPGTGWIPRTGDENLQLRSRDFSVSFSKAYNFRELWNKKMGITANVSSRIYFDLQKYTESNLNFTIGYTMKINELFDLTMSANSDNKMIYRYFRNLPFFSDVDIDIPEGPQNNFFLDLFDSFRFDNEELRKRSGFKMRNFRITATRYLGDWTAALTWSMSPFRPQGSRESEMNNEVSFSVYWIPISEFRSDISYNKRNKPNEWIVRGLGN